jgi:hypothetical protein
MVITEFVPNERFAFRSSYGPGVFAATWRFEAVGEGTDIVTEPAYETWVPGLSRLIPRLTGMAFRAGWGLKLAAAIEGHAKEIATAA